MQCFIMKTHLATQGITQTQRNSLSTKKHNRIKGRKGGRWGYREGGGWVCPGRLFFFFRFLFKKVGGKGEFVHRFSRGLIGIQLFNMRL